MTNNNEINSDPLPTAGVQAQVIEEAAYYIGLNRERDSQEGDSLTDWLQAEKEAGEVID
jgi:hypothetical protein